MSPESKYSEWRVLTPILLAVITFSGALVSYLAIDKLNNMTDMNIKTFGLISEVKSSFEDYKVTAEGRFAHIETELADGRK